MPGHVKRKKSRHDGPRCGLPSVAIYMPRGYGATAARLTSDQKGGSWNLSVFICSYQRGHSDITKFCDLMWHLTATAAGLRHAIACLCLQRTRVWSAWVLTNKTVWPSAPRRWLKAPFREGVGSKPTPVTFVHLIPGPRSGCAT